MAVAFSAIPSDEQAKLAKDYPIIGENVIPTVPTTQKWTESATSATDRSDSGYPVLRSHDDDPDLETKPDATAASEWFLTFDLGAEFEVDFVALIGHNFGTLVLTDVDFDISTSGGLAFTTQHRCEIAQNPASDDRIIQLDLLHTGSDPLRYTGVQHCRLRMLKGSNFTPEIRELIVGRRRQLPRNPDTPFNPDALKHSENLIGSKGMSYSNTQWARNGLELDGSWTIKNNAEFTDLRAWWVGAKSSFVWIWNPSSAPDSWRLMMRENDTLQSPVEGWARRNFTLHAFEQGPEEWLLENQ